MNGSCRKRDIAAGTNHYPSPSPCHALIGEISHLRAMFASVCVGVSVFADGGGRRDL